ncbi:MAG TPA: hypothetical protein VFZ34_02360 [Blastocatellia bacterium]|nr:hypothetical protein [Blastocatellia bacterium]
MKVRNWIAAITLLCLCELTTTRAQSVRCAECFPLEKLAPELRAKSEALLLKALDTEALYTIVGGLKPMSSGFASFQFAVAKPALKAVEETRQMLSVWRCGEALYADVHHFAKTFPDPKTKEEMRFAEAVVFHRPALAATIARHPAYFAPFGLTPQAHPLETLLAIEYSAPGPRWRGQGYLFGFPDYAVDFFVNAGESQEQTGQFVKREFYSLPTFSATERRFVWAVPVGHQERDEDRALKQQAETILAEYKLRRARYIGAGKPGVVKMLRNWLTDKRGNCSLQNARFGWQKKAAMAVPR